MAFLDYDNILEIPHLHIWKLPSFLAFPVLSSNCFVHGNVVSSCNVPKGVASTQSSDSCLLVAEYEQYRHILENRPNLKKEFPFHQSTTFDTVKRLPTSTNSALVSYKKIHKIFGDLWRIYLSFLLFSFSNKLYHIENCVILLFESLMPPSMCDIEQTAHFTTTSQHDDDVVTDTDSDEIIWRKHLARHNQQLSCRISKQRYYCVLFCCFMFRFVTWCSKLFREIVIGVRWIQRTIYFW